MARPRSSQPTNAELAILRVLWERGPSTVREVHDALPRHDDIGYTTVLKMLQIMADKGQVKRAVRGRGHVYRAALPREVVQRRLVADLIDRVFGGSTASLVMQALAAKQPGDEELARIRGTVGKAKSRGR